MENERDSTNDTQTDDEFITFFDSGEEGLQRQYPRIPQKILSLFLSDARDCVVTAQKILDHMQRPYNGVTKEQVTELFRIFHAAKCACKISEIGAVQELIFSIENILSLVCRDRIDFDDELTDLIRQSIGFLILFFDTFEHQKTAQFDEVLLKSLLFRIAGLCQKNVAPKGTDTNEKVPDSVFTSRPRTATFKHRTDTTSFLRVMVEDLTVAMGALDDGSSRFVEVLKIVKRIQRIATEL